jgi:hypothetical protein
MNQRERVLALCLVSVLGGLGAWVLADRALVKPMQSLKANIRTTEQRRDELDHELKRLAGQERRWKDLTRRTFSVDEAEAQRRLREEVQALLEKHGMSDVRVTPQMRSAKQRGQVELPVQVQASGRLKAVVGFLCDFYQRGYLARIDRMTLSANAAVISEYNSSRARPAAGPRARGRGGSDAAGPELTLNMTVSTLVLDKRPKMEHPVLPPDATDVDGDRLLRPVDAYDMIVDRNPFRPYEPPVVVPREREPDPVVTPPEEVVEVVRPVPETPPPDALVTGIESWEGERVAYVLFAPRTGEARVQKFTEGMSLFDGGGTVILIHREGIVARVHKGGAVRDYFYARGSNFRERVELNAAEHPVVWRAVRG